MKSAADKAYEALAAAAVGARVAGVRAQARRVRQAEDPDGIHDLRVATRRLRTALRLFEPVLGPAARPLRRRLRDLADALGASRDLDVQLEFLRGFVARQGANSRFRPGPQRLLLRLQQRRHAAGGDVAAALAELDRRGVLAELERLVEPLVEGAAPAPAVSAPHPASLRSYAGGVCRQARKAIQRRLKKLLSYERHLPHAKLARELHQMRIQAKRLRYTLEIFEPLYGRALAGPLRAARQVQTLLGELHDCDVWLALLPGFLAEEQALAARTPDLRVSAGVLRPGLRRLEADRRRRRRQLHRAAVRFWSRLRRQRTWERLASIANC